MVGGGVGKKDLIQSWGVTIQHVQFSAQVSIKEYNILNHVVRYTR